DVDVRTVAGQLVKNGDVVEEGVAAAVLGNPVNAVAWLANKLHQFDVSFEPGQFILTGSFLRATPVAAGDEIVARFDNGFGDVKASFV
ncbi:MAG: 4-oxalocrotonate decarboxylase, partial [Pseudomonadota bacterium]